MRKPADLITWFKQPDGRIRLFLSTRDKADAEEASHVFAWLVKAFVVSLKADENGLYEAILRPK